LRHVARTRVLGHVVDLGARDPEYDFGVIREELRMHDAELLEKPALVIANKLDLPGADERLAGFREARKADGLLTVAVSARDGVGLDGLIAALGQLLPDAATLAQPGEPAGVVVHRFEATNEGFSVDKAPDGFRVRGRRIERLAAQTDFAREESAERFQRDMARMGVERELVRAGVEPGDTVHIGTAELEWDGLPWG